MRFLLRVIVVTVLLLMVWRIARSWLKQDRRVKVIPPERQRRRSPRTMIVDDADNNENNDS